MAHQLREKNDSVAVARVVLETTAEETIPGIAPPLLLFARYSLPFGQRSFFIISTSF
jgi:hypothetical protein